MESRGDHAAVAAAATARRRAAGAAGGPGQLARVRRGIRALPPAAVPLLPLDPARRRRCAGCAPVDVHARVGGAEARSTERAAASVAVPDRPQRVDLAAAPAPARRGGRWRTRRFAVVASAEDQAGERARLAMLMGDLAALPERARSALVMRELSGLSHEEIAIALETSPGAAKQAIFEARRALAECAEGRAMACAEICRAISDGDRRVLRGRRVRAHLRDCPACAAFASSIEARQSELRALVPVLPAAVSAAVLSRAMEAGVGGAGAGAVAGSGGALTGSGGAAAGAAARGPRAPPARRSASRLAPRGLRRRRCWRRRRSALAGWRRWCGSRRTPAGSCMHVRRRSVQAVGRVRCIPRLRATRAATPVLRFACGARSTHAPPRADSVRFTPARSHGTGLPRWHRAVSLAGAAHTVAVATVCGPPPRARGVHGRAGSSSGGAKSEAGPRRARPQNRT